MEILCYNFKWMKSASFIIALCYCHSCVKQTSKNFTENLKETKTKKLNDYINMALSLGHANILGLIFIFLCLPKFL